MYFFTPWPEATRRNDGDPRAAATRKMLVVPVKRHESRIPKGRTQQVAPLPAREVPGEYGRNSQNVVRRGDGRVARAVKAALRAPVVNEGISASVQTRATSSRLCASELRVTA